MHVASPIRDRPYSTREEPTSKAVGLMLLTDRLRGRSTQPITQIIQYPYQHYYSWKRKLSLLAIRETKQPLLARAQHPFRRSHKRLFEVGLRLTFQYSQIIHGKRR